MARRNRRDTQIKIPEFSFLRVSAISAGIFRKETGTRKALFLTIITTFGLKQNAYSTGLVQNDLRLDALFKRVDYGVLQ